MDSDTIVGRNRASNPGEDLPRSPGPARIVRNFSALLTPARGAAAPKREARAAGGGPSLSGPAVARAGNSSAAASTSETSRQIRETHAPGVRAPAPPHGRETGASALLGDTTDPLARALAHAVSPPGVGSEPPAGPERTLATAGPLLPPGHLAGMERMLKRIAWGGDKTRGVVELEFGDGELAGACLQIESSGGALSLELELPPGVESEKWVKRLRERLAGRGLSIDGFEVR